MVQQRNIPCTTEPVSSTENFYVCVMRQIANNFYVQEKSLQLYTKYKKSLTILTIFFISQAKQYNGFKCLESNQIGYYRTLLLQNIMTVSNRNLFIYTKFSDFRKKERSIVCIDIKYKFLNTIFCSSVKSLHQIYNVC